MAARVPPIDDGTGIGPLIASAMVAAIGTAPPLPRADLPPGSA